MSKGGGIFLRGTPAHSALLGLTPTLPSLHIRAAVHVRTLPDFLNYSSLLKFLCASHTDSFFPPLFITSFIYVEDALSSHPNFNSGLVSSCVAEVFRSCPQINKFSKADPNIELNMMPVISFHLLFSLCQCTNKRNYS